MTGIVAAKLHAGITMKVTGELPGTVNYAVKRAYILPLLETHATGLPEPVS